MLSHTALTVYDDSLHKFLKLLCILMHIIISLSAHTTELTCLKYINTFITMWNFFIINDQLVTLMKYNKTQTLQEHLKIIVCYLSDLIASLFVFLIADVLSFYKFLIFIIHRLLSQASVILYLWHDQGTSWAIKKLTWILQWESQSGLQTSLNVVT